MRLDVYPDGGLARLGVNGEVDKHALVAMTVRWLERLPRQHALAVLTQDAGLPTDEAEKQLAQLDAVPPSVIADLLAD